MDSSTETVFVRLMDEGVEAWRAVDAHPVGGGVYRLPGAPASSEGVREFGPGAVVRVGTRIGSEGPFQAALTLASDRRAG